MSSFHRETELQTQIKECQQRLAFLALERESSKPGDTLKSLIRQTAQQARWLDLYRRELSTLRNTK